MVLTPFVLLILVALICTVASLVSPRYPLLAVAVLLVCITLLLAR